MSFVLVPSSYEQVPYALLTAVPEFAQSEEYRLIYDMSDLPGVVLAAFAKFLASIATSMPGSSVLASGLDIVDRLCAGHDYRIKTAIDDEFFSTLAEHPDAIAAILLTMRPQLRDAYSRWASNQS